MIRVTCPGCQSKLNAKVTLAGQTRKCPNCGAAVEIPEVGAEQDASPEGAVAPDEAPPDQRVHGAVEEHLPRAKTLDHLERLNKYWICDKARLIALWEGDGRGWMLKTSTGLIPARRNVDQIPAHGNFTLVELIMETTEAGLRLAGLMTYKLAERWALPDLGKSDEKILRQIRGPGSLNSEQKTLIWNQIKSRFMPDVWEDSDKVREYLSNTDFVSAGTP